MVHSILNYVILHGNVFVGSDLELLKDSAVIVANGKIERVVTDSLEAEKYAKAHKYQVFDVNGAYVGPGLIDMHIHGCGGHDTGEPDKKAALEAMATFLCNRGITSFQPAVVPDIETMSQVEKAVNSSDILSYHVTSVYNEGPFIAMEKKGGLPEESIRVFTPEYMEKLLSFKIRKQGEGSSVSEKTLLGTMTFAPELEGADVARKMLEEAGVKVAWGHSASYVDQLPDVRGTHYTHLFNAMNGIDHHRPGLAIAPFLDKYSDSTCELIGDTVHVNPITMKFIFKNIGTGRVCLISDSMSAGGMGPGESVYLGRDVVCDGMVSRYKENGTLIGSAMMISDTVRNLCKNGFIRIDDIFRIASVNQARVLKLKDRGEISSGRRGDLLVLGKDLEIRDVFISREMNR